MDNKNEDVELLDKEEKIEKVEGKTSKYEGMPSRLDVFDINKEEMVEKAKEEQIEEEPKEKTDPTPKQKKSKKTLIIVIIVVLFLAISAIAVTYAIEVRRERDYEYVYKPIIYIYPEDEKDVTITLSNPEKLTVTYPKYNDSWQVHADPSGTLTDKEGKKYYALYWEGKEDNNKVQEDGFVVEGKDTIEFLEEKLKILGLNYKESNEFIMYWLPKLESNKYNYIRFKTIDEINESMSLDIEPKPDTLIRIVMEYKPLDKKINVKEQKLTKPKRKGYTVVEWGGTKLQ